MSCGNPFLHPMTWEEVESEEGGQFCVLFIFIVTDNRVTSTRQVFFMIEGVVLLSKTLLMATRFFFHFTSRYAFWNQIYLGTELEFHQR